MTRQAMYQAVVKDVMAAIECADRGESHGRLNRMMLRTVVLKTAFMPPCPESVLPPERRRFTNENPAPISNADAYFDFRERAEGRFGAIRQE